CRLPGLSQGARSCLRGNPDGGAGLLPPAQPLSPGAAAGPGRRLEPLDALAEQHARAPLPPTLRFQRPHLAGRFKAFPIEQDEHLLVVLRYSERNAVRAGLVRRAENWPWSSARYWQEGEKRPSYLSLGPVKRPRNWLEWVNKPLTDGELEAQRQLR